MNSTLQTYANTYVALKAPVASVVQFSAVQKGGVVEASTGSSVCGC